MSDLGLIALITAAALIGPALSFLSTGKVPVVVGQLLAGVILGETGFQIVDPHSDSLSLLYTLGFATLMFTVGMHVPLHDGRIRGALRGGTKATALTIVPAIAAGYGAHLVGGGPSLLYAVLILSSSAAVALPVLEESGLEGVGVLTLIAWITLADIVATVAVPLVSDPTRAGGAALGALAVIALVGAVFAIANFLRRFAVIDRIRDEGKARSWAIDLRVAVVILISLSYFAQQVGASVLVAGFGTGLVVGALGGPKRLSTEVLGLGQGFLVPMFFVLLGAKLNLRELNDRDAVALAVALASATVAVHALVGAASRIGPGLGLIATAQMGVPAAAIALGLPAGALDQGQASAIFCAALVSIGACSLGAGLEGARIGSGSGKKRSGKSRSDKRPHKDKGKDHPN